MVTASLHWIAWKIILPRFRELLAPGNVLAIVEQRQAPLPSDAAAAFDADVERLVRPFARDDVITVEISGLIVWGIPAPITARS